MTITVQDSTRQYKTIISKTIDDYHSVKWYSSRPLNCDYLTFATRWVLVLFAESFKTVGHAFFISEKGLGELVSHIILAYPPLSI